MCLCLHLVAGPLFLPAGDALSALSCRPSPPPCHVDPPTAPLPRPRPLGHVPRPHGDEVGAGANHDAMAFQPQRLRASAKQASDPRCCSCLFRFRGSFKHQPMCNGVVAAVRAALVDAGAQHTPTCAPRPRRPWRSAPYSFSSVASASLPARRAGARPTGRGRSCDTSPAGEPGASRKSCDCVALAPASASPAGSKPRSGRRRASGSRRWPTTSTDYFSSTHTGAWSLAPSCPRTSRSMPAPFSRRASVFDNRIWSSRSPASRGQRFRR